MPELCRFYGIIIRMFINDHPPAHFHAEYQGREALFDINSLDIIKGDISHRARVLVVEWALEHRQELLKNWKKRQIPEQLDKIEPLK